MERAARRIAIFEPDEDNRALMVAMLDRRYLVVAPDDPADLFAVIRAHRPHVVVSDVGDDAAHGAALLDALRQEPGLEATAVIAVTSGVGPGIEDRWRRLGFDRCITKPILDKRDLWTTIDLLCVALGAGGPDDRPSPLPDKRANWKSVLNSQ